MPADAISEAPQSGRSTAPFRKVLVANRGAVAARVIRAVHALGCKAVAVHSDADAGAPYLEEADEVIRIGPAPARESYLNQDALLEAATKAGADALHPGYGFLSENEAFAARTAAMGITFIGPSPRHIGAMGEKTRARMVMAENGFPVAAGSGLLPADPDEVLRAARAIGFPVMVKPAGGGGGIGMAVARDEASLLRTVERARAAAERSFADGGVYLERFLERARHVEVQVLGDRHGQVRHLFERDCSIQRRHQKVIEEAPAPNLARGPAADIAQRAAEALQRLGYDNIGTVEMLMGEDGSFGFLEVNTRLQVEHAVTEMVTGLDLVAAQIRAAAGEALDRILPPRIDVEGHAVEARIYAEDPRRFIPSPGRLTRFRLPRGNADWRIETGYREGMEVTPFYDPLLAKAVVRGRSREEAIRGLRELLAAVEIEGPKTNIPFLLAVLDDPRFQAGEVHTGLAAEIRV
ncbi:MAG: ATP-grasp domain-containing protein [Acetobacteraceae bacterium]|nr:ATP-grasp domain-containing protein [Acetobacteraceae bacterium]